MKSRLEDIFAALKKPGDIDVLEAQERKLWTPDHLSRIVAMTQSHVRRHLTTLQLERRAHVVGWTTQHPAPIWAQGAGDSVPRPRGLSMSEHQARYRRSRAEGGKKPGPQEGQALIGRSRERTYKTIAAAMAAGPQSWFASLESSKPAESAL